MQAQAAEFSGHVSESSSSCLCLLIKTDGKSWSFRLRGLTQIPKFGIVLVLVLGALGLRDRKGTDVLQLICSVSLIAKRSGFSRTRTTTSTRTTANTIIAMKSAQSGRCLFRGRRQFGYLIFRRFARLLCACYSIRSHHFCPG